MKFSNEEYKKLQPLLFSIGYRLLGSVKDAEDAVQEVFLRGYEMDGDGVENKKAYLCKMMTNRCLDIIKSAQYKREQYIGPWLPEPLVTGEGGDMDPAEMLIEKEGLSISYLRMMENLVPHERAVLLLREAFRFSYAEIASFVDKREDYCRQLYRRAKKKLSAVEKESLDFERNKTMVQRFISAFQSENIEELLGLLSEEVTLYSDGGGKVKAAVRPIISRNRVLSFIKGVMNQTTEKVSVFIREVNYQPAIVFFLNGKLHSVVSFYICKETIKEIYLIMNPDKLPLKKFMLEGGF
ncbi:RNA polymerase sigma-70 factor [Evansella cellulosilytica]|uniref:RNA polymerase, sigma-24 subunit, ECF subfamily n=1 Tax=Evansella cellulosilytica (strain ATCC 21833 / DSM 2522 / FERM P-1141 / JCM 9156 / N-4) TaxID=649639 RepID=E6TSM9_EVAC2|nr:RNA polymerase sigma-70 factor [Evansella cellulosilytica]ADU29537.1 RNA polymerase, sigma-24 subunit, ECF subfamily [Evansella cellulosilytica DSM 2522]